jgi:hypothetical protein
MPDYIPGVYNYCDRWCERCHLTARCRSFAFEQAITARGDVRKAFWETFDASISANPEFEALLAEAADDDDEDWSESLGITFGNDDRPFGRAEDEPLAQAALAYGMQARAWLQRHAPRPPGEAGPSPSGLGAKVDDALDVVAWYGLQIGVKLLRAIHGEQSLTDEFPSPAAEDTVADDSNHDDPFGTVPDEDEFGSDGADDDLRAAAQDTERIDHDGSARVALVGIERSLGAWTQLRDPFPGESAAIRRFQQILARFRVEITRRFPGARLFQSPWFDIRR